MAKQSKEITKTTPPSNPKQSKTIPKKTKKPTRLNSSKKGEKTKQKTMSLKKEIRRKWSTIQRDVENSGGVSLKLGRKLLFKCPEELLEIFNLYLSSIQKKIKKANEIPGEIYERMEDGDWQTHKETHTKGVKIDTIIDEIWIFTALPTKLGFYVFMGGMTSEARSEYKKKKEYSETIGIIETYLESVVENGALQGKINPTIAQFVLNTTYGRVPKQINLDKEYEPTEEENKKIANLLSIN